MENSPEINSLLILAIGTAAMLLLSFSIVGIVLIYQRRVLKQKFELQEMEVAYQKRLLDAAIDSQEQERKRISSELHDGVGAMLSTIKLNLGFLKSEMENPTGLEALQETNQLLNETIEGVRRISKDLMPSTLGLFGLKAALKEFCGMVGKPGEISLYFYEPSSELALDERQQLLVYRIVQEAVNNALKHAQATEIHIRLMPEDGQAMLEVEDNGRGFDFANLHGTGQQAKGVGLYSIENRALMLDKMAVWGPAREGKGTVLRLIAPEERHPFVAPTQAQGLT
jgi:two-component system, NarL family, sensor kinase